MRGRAARLSLIALTFVHTAWSQTVPRDFALPLPLFAEDSAWNELATGTAVLPDSEQQILILYRVLRGDTSTLYPPGLPPSTTWPFMDINYDDYSIPVFRTGSTTQKVRMEDYEGNLGGNPKLAIDPDGTVTVPAPFGNVRPAGPQTTDADGHAVLFDPSTFMEYDYWNATTAVDIGGNSLGGGQTGTAILRAGTVDYFDVREAGANPDSYWSARATGPPLLAGLILPEDIEQGAIEHALAFAIPGPRNTHVADPQNPYASDYFYPVSTTETDYFNTNPLALASGQRIRMKATLVDENGSAINESQFAPITGMFITALRTYGAYVVDNAGGFSFSAEDIHTAVLHLTDNELNTLIGETPGTPLPPGKTKWQIAIEKLNEDLWQIPLAYGPWTPGQDPSTAQVTTSNFDVIEPATVLYLLDGFGGVHPGGGATSSSPATPYFGFDVAEDLELTGSGFYVLDGFGGVHAGGGAMAMSPGTPYFGFDIARDMELAAAGFYVLDGFGGVHAGGGATALSPGTPYFGFDVALDLEIATSGFYVLDSFGGVHAGGGAPTMSPVTPYFGFEVARDLELASSGFLTLDGFGGVHAGGGATITSPTTPYFGFDIAKDLELGGGGLYVLDGFGGVHAGGGAKTMSPATSYFGFNIGKDIELK